MKALKNLLIWQNYVHYILLTAGVSWVATWFGAPIDWKMFFILLSSIFVIDTAIHFMFAVLPKPLKWED